MSNLVKIDSNLLSNDVAKMDVVTKKMRELFDEVKNQTDSLKDVWSTKTSEAVYLDLEEFYKLCETAINTNEEDARFLENVVNSNYINLNMSNK